MTNCCRLFVTQLTHTRSKERMRHTVAVRQAQEERRSCAPRVEWLWTPLRLPRAGEVSLKRDEDAVTCEKVRMDFTARTCFERSRHCSHTSISDVSIVIHDECIDVETPGELRVDSNEYLQTHTIKPCSDLSWDDR